jgi:hypothetical protein
MTCPFGFSSVSCSTKGVQGTIRYNGNDLGSRKEGKETCYIMQEDCLTPLFTVYEVMTLCANLKLGSCLPEKAKQLLVSRHITNWMTYRCHAVLLCLNHRFPDFWYCSPPNFAWKFGRARLLCDGTNCSKEGKSRENMAAEWVCPLWATPAQKPAARSQLKSVPHMSICCKRICTRPSAHIWKLSFAFASSHCKWALLI